MFFKLTGVLVAIVMPMLVVILILFRLLKKTERNNDNLLFALLKSPHKRSNTISKKDCIKFVSDYSEWVDECKIPTVTGSDNYMKVLMELDDLNSLRDIKKHLMVFGGVNYKNNLHHNIDIHIKSENCEMTLDGNWLSDAADNLL